MNWIYDIAEFTADSPLVRGAGILLLTVLAAKLLYSVSYRILRHAAARRPRDTMGIFLERIRRPSSRLIVSLALWAAVPSSGLSETAVGYLQHLLILLIILWITLIALTGIRAIAQLLVRQFDLNAKDNLQARKVNTQVRVFEQIADAAVVIIAISGALMTFEGVQQIGASILASAGIAGLIIGVAAQKSLANVVAGVMIAITQPIRLDDAVIIENEWGRIEEITLTYVVVRIWDKRRLIVPITYFMDKPFQNWTRSSSEILGTIILHLDYRMPIDVLRAKQSEILAATDLWDKEVDVIQVIDTTPTTIVVRCLVSAVDSPTAWDLRVLVREQLIAFLQQDYPDCLPRTRVEADISEYPEPAPAGAGE